MGVLDVGVLRKVRRRRLDVGGLGQVQEVDVTQVREDRVLRRSPRPLGELLLDGLDLRGVALPERYQEAMLDDEYADDRVGAAE